MNISILTIFIAYLYLAEGAPGCKQHFNVPKDCDLWLKELGPSTTDDKNNEMYDDRLVCVNNLASACGATMKTLKQGDTVKVILKYLSITYYIYTDEESANQMIGYIGGDDDDDDDD